MTDLIHAVTLESLRDMAQALGFRATLSDGSDGVRTLQSAANGLGFEIRLGNSAPDGEDGAVDFRFVTAIRVEGQLDLALVNAWNNDRRFGRLRLDGPALAMDLDASVAGGVAPAHLAGQFEIWNRLIGALMDVLRSGGRTESAPAQKAPQRERAAASA